MRERRISHLPSNHPQNRLDAGMQYQAITLKGRRSHRRRTDHMDALVQLPSHICPKSCLCRARRPRPCLQWPPLILTAGALNRLGRSLRRESLLICLILARAMIADYRKTGKDNPVLDDLPTRNFGEKYACGGPLAQGVTPDKKSRELVATALPYRGTNDEEPAARSISNRKMKATSHTLQGSATTGADEEFGRGSTRFQTDMGGDPRMTHQCQPGPWQGTLLCGSSLYVLTFGDTRVACAIRSDGAGSRYRSGHRIPGLMPWA